ncbi:MAG TPA: patatin-like phospholipase family protein [Bacteroidetes bacterium]|nr:patatin-like phospholipase family protein [Bacteroidota bacterium]
MFWRRLLDRFGAEQGLVLALSGGGARGLAHIGVLQVLEKHGVRPDLITGTSMGAIVGGLYALHDDAGRVRDKAMEVVESESFKRFGLDDLLEKQKGGSRASEEFGQHVRRLFLLTRMMRKPAIIEGQLLLDTLRDVFGDASFSDLTIPFIAIASDLISGEDIELATGPLAPAIAASASIPGVFEPVRMESWYLVDGGVTKNVPIPDGQSTTRSKVIAVDVLPGLTDSGPFLHGVDVLSRADQITMLHLNRFYLSYADVVIKPEVRKVHWADFHRMDELIEAGVKATEEVLEEIID